MAVGYFKRIVSERPKRLAGALAAIAVLGGAIGAAANAGGVAAGAVNTTASALGPSAILTGYAALVPTDVTNGYVGLSGQVDALPANSMAAGTVPRTGTISRLYVSVDHFPSGSLALTLVINGRATAIGCTVAASPSTQALRCSDTKGSVIVAAGATVSLRAANNRVAYHDLRWSATFV